MNKLLRCPFRRNSETANNYWIGKRPMISHHKLFGTLTMALDKNPTGCNHLRTSNESLLPNSLFYRQLNDHAESATKTTRTLIKKLSSKIY